MRAVGSLVRFVNYGSPCKHGIMGRLDDRERVEVLSASAWREWLLKNHTRSEGVWVVTLKKGASGYVPKMQLVAEALCFGWIDSVPRKLDARRTMVYYSPRKVGSGWSRVNKRLIDELRASNRLHPSGRAKIEAAKRDGSWDKLESIDNLQIPDDLMKALDASSPAKRNFQAFPPSVRRGILEWIGAAKRSDTRARRIAETARLAADNVRANQWPRNP